MFDKIADKVMETLMETPRGRLSIATNGLQRVIERNAKLIDKLEKNPDSLELTQKLRKSTEDTLSLLNSYPKAFSEAVNEVIPKS